MKSPSRFLWLALYAALGFFIGGKWNLPLAAWIAPIFAIRFFRQSDKAGRNFLLLWAVSALTTILSWYNATSMHYLHPVAEPIFFAVLAPLTLFPYVVDRLYYRRFGDSVWLTLIYPVAATAMDYFSANGSPFGTFGAGAYSQRDFLAALQIASVTGLWGITFVASWFSSLVNHLWDQSFKFTRLSLTFTGIIALIMGLALARSLAPAHPEQTARIAGFSLPDGALTALMAQLQDGDEAGFRDAVNALHAEELAQIRTLADEGAQIIVLQEGAGMGFSDQVDKLLADAAALAQEKGVYIVLPTFDFGKTPAENVVRILDPHGEVALTHVKYGGNEFEGTLKGDGILQTVDTPFGKLSAVICWDADFPNVIQQAGQQDVDLLFVPSNDWYEVRDIHAGMATFRAAENGMALFRQTGQGVSLVTDARGQVLNRVDMFEEQATGFTGMQRVEVPVGSVETLYTSVGDWFGVAMLIGLVGLLGGWFVMRKKGIQQ